MFAHRLTEDRLSALLLQYGMTSDLFYSGALCTRHQFNEEDGLGHMHVVHAGQLFVESPDEEDMVLEAGELVFFPRPHTHAVVNRTDGTGLEVMCASIRMGDTAQNPLAMALPDVLRINVHRNQALNSTLQLMFAEGFAKHQGRGVALNNLLSYFMVQLLREVIMSDEARVGLLAAWGDERLAKAVLAMHNAPEKKWTVDYLGDLAGMSRARFAHHFKDKVGSTPMEYLTHLRLSRAKAMMLQGKPIKAVSVSVGYSGSAAFDRAFHKTVGKTPTEWLMENR